MSSFQIYFTVQSSGDFLYRCSSSNGLCFLVNKPKKYPMSLKIEFKVFHLFQIAINHLLKRLFLLSEQFFTRSNDDFRFFMCPSSIILNFNVSKFSKFADYHLKPPNWDCVKRAGFVFLLFFFHCRTLSASSLSFVTCWRRRTVWLIFGCVSSTDCFSFFLFIHGNVLSCWKKQFAYNFFSLFVSFSSSHFNDVLRFFEERCLFLNFER